MGEMLTLRLEGGRGEILTGSMLPTYGEDAHLQPTDAPHPDHRPSVKFKHGTPLLLIITKITFKKKRFKKLSSLGGGYGPTANALKQHSTR